MLSYFPRIYFLLTAFIPRTVNGQECEAGWFGEECRYMCHCEKSTSCDHDTGECPNDGPCARSYFGPGCQFIDLEANSSVPPYLRDGKEDTCNPNTAATSAELRLKSEYPFSFIRIIVNDERILENNFTVTLNDGLPCSNQRSFQINDTIVDVTCNAALFNKLKIDGAIAGSICSVYISGGRNVALRQQTVQTSTADPYDNNKASNAVDGNTDPDANNGHCSRTNAHLYSPDLNLIFNRPQLIYHIRLYNRNVDMDQLAKFKIKTYEKAITRFTHEDTSTIGQDIYHINVPSPKSVVTVIISLVGNNRYLLVCEVETFGDTVCPKHSYGLYCQHHCQCLGNEECYVVTGACPSGCQQGFYGYNCIYPCSMNCLQNICERRTGRCVQCPSGYAGDMCDKVCAVPYYGELCDKKCPSSCLDRLCDRITGNCFACAEGFKGDKCTSDNGLIYLWLLVIPIILIVLCLVVFIRRNNPLAAEVD